MNKGKWTQDEHRAFMKKWKKYGNNWIEVAKSCQHTHTGSNKEAC
jgi:hypothetical protein